MAKFTFRLETLRKIRSSRRDQQRTALAEAFRAEEVLNERRLYLQQEQQSARNQHRLAASDKYTDVNRLLEIQRYDLVLAAQAQELTKQEILLAAEIERRRLALVESDREVRILDLLEEKQRAAHRRDESRAESKQFDEIAIIRQCRN